MAATAAGAAVVAAVLGQPAWAAAVGAGLMLLYWGLEVLAWRRGEASASMSGAVGVALAGMVLRLAVVVGLLVALALLARDAFTTAIVAFIVALTLYTALRLYWYADAAAHAGARPS